jgi:hypothetical protein
MRFFTLIEVTSLRSEPAQGDQFLEQISHGAEFDAAQRHLPYEYRFKQ